MARKSENRNNSFGLRLEQLLLESNVKNATIAQALNYDISYISKWITGTAVPSRKNIGKIAAAVSRLVVEQSTPETCRTLMERFGAKDEDTLRNALEDALQDAYYETAGELNESRYVNNAVLRVAPGGRFPLLEDYAAELEGASEPRIAVAADLFALEHAAKLALAGIEESRFRLKERRDDLHLDYVIDLDSLDRDSVYDVILLIHMMTCFSLADFRLYCSSRAAERTVIAAKDAFAGVTLLGQNRQALCTTVTRDRRVVSELYDQVKSLAEPDNLVFQPVDMTGLLLHHEYFHNLLSRNKRWLVGHMTEHFLSPELSARLLAQHFSGVEAEEAGRACLLAGSAVQSGLVRVLLYDSALVDFVLTGELDFFNRRVVLTPEQRRQEIAWLRELILKDAGGSFRLIREGFSADFKYITNPCAFLSDSVNCLRLENKRYENNLLLVKNETAKEIFSNFFEKGWEYGRGVVVADPGEIAAKLEDLMGTAELLAK